MRDAQEASDEAREFPISRETEETTDTRRFSYFFFFLIDLENLARMGLRTWGVGG